MAEIDTIAAVATPPGNGGVCIIRISGPKAEHIAESLAGKCPEPRYAAFCRFTDQQQKLIDEGLVIYFPAPHSFTGEDVVELHGHGGMVVSDMLLKATLDAGARMATAGEFSLRAFLNNKMDLLQAEAIADLIEASSTRAARAALRTLEGEFSEKISALLNELTALRVYVEAALDFADEEIDLLKSGDIQDRLERLHQQLKIIWQSANRGKVLGEGMQIVIAGYPNAGKSSLMNQLSGRESAIVTDIPGTTRDIIREQLTIDGIPIHLHDTAGIREGAEEIEQEGIRRARDSLLKADVVLWVHDDTTELQPEAYQEYADDPFILIRNKVDLTDTAPGVVIQDGQVSVAVSLKSLDGLDDLRQEIVKIANLQVVGEENDYSARRRHLDALARCEQSLNQAEIRLAEQIAHNTGGELLAEELRQAQQSLGEVTGQFTPDDLLGEIFGEFCIGK